MEQKLYNLFAYLKGDYMVHGAMWDWAAEAFLTEHLELDYAAVREVCGPGTTKADVNAMYKYTFGEAMPLRFRAESAQAPMYDFTKEQFLELYDPAKYKKAKLWVWHIFNEYGGYVPRATIFDWIMSTSKEHKAMPEPLNMM